MEMDGWHCCYLDLYPVFPHKSLHKVSLHFITQLLLRERRHFSHKEDPWVPMTFFGIDCRPCKPGINGIKSQFRWISGFVKKKEKENECFLFCMALLFN